MSRILSAGYHMVLDVESVGLHGDGFAYAFVVICEGRAVEKDPHTGLFHRAAAHTWPHGARGTKADREWVEKHVTTADGSELLRTRREVRSHFWERWDVWRNQGALLWADVAWPVEARFLLEAVRDEDVDEGWKERAQSGPYPLHDVATLAEALGYADLPRLPEEMPEHDPMKDARHSARKLSRCLQALRERTREPVQDEDA